MIEDSLFKFISGPKKLELIPISNGDARLRKDCKNHYSKPKGFVGRNICYGIVYGGVWYGSIVVGSATLHLPGRNEFFSNAPLNNLVNNTFYHIDKDNGKYPIRNFTVKVLAEFRKQILIDWKKDYGDEVLGFESLIELPRTGELYLRDGWTEVGLTKGFTCKREGGKGSDDWGGKRVWNKDKDNLRPKRVFCRKP